jgi:hypothetical protein
VTGRVLYEMHAADRVFRFVVSGDGHLLVQEVAGRHVRSHRIGRADLDAVRAARDPFSAAEDLFHQARLKKKARRTGEGSGRRCVTGFRCLRP